MISRCAALCALVSAAGCTAPATELTGQPAVAASTAAAPSPRQAAVARQDAAFYGDAYRRATTPPPESAGRQPDGSYLFSASGAGMNAWGVRRIPVRPPATL